jgi:hypothetical protein
MEMLTSGDDVVDGVEVVVEARGAGTRDVGLPCGAVETGAGGAVREATDRDEVDEVAGRDVLDTAVVLTGAGVTACPLDDVSALAGAAPSAAALCGRMKANDSRAVSPPIHSRTSDGSGFQLASRPACCRCRRNSRT